MRVLLAVFITLACILPATAAAQQAQEPQKSSVEKWVWVEEQVNIAETETKKVVAETYFSAITANLQLKSWLGVVVQYGHGNSWQEVVAGPSFQIGEVLLSVAIGHEPGAPLPKRGRAFLYWDDEDEDGRPKHFFYVEADTGIGKGDRTQWVNVEAVKMVGKFEVGIFGEMPGTGFGPKLGLRPKKNFGFWISPVYDWEKKSWKYIAAGRQMF